MEARLKEYRELQRRQRRIEQSRNKNSTLHNIYSKFLSMKPGQDTAEEKRKEAQEIEDAFNRHREQEEARLQMIEDEQAAVEQRPEPQRLVIIRWMFYVVLWFTLYALFLTLQFGAVFFAVSVLAGIYYNTRTHPKKMGEMSAYSVFNENFESIDGTITPEVLQRNMALGGIRLF